MMNQISKAFANPLKLPHPLLWAVLVASAWLALWYLPWQAELHSIVWLQLGGALILFVAPGACVYGILVDRGGVTFSHVTFGFVISHLMFALLGTLGRYFHLSFDAMKFAMAGLDYIFMVIYLRRRIRDGIQINLKQINAARIIALSTLLLVALAACLVVIQRVLTDDDMTYLAYLTRWQFSNRLDFNDLIFGEPSLVHPRFWLMSAPFAQALLADLSQAPGILILSGYYEPFLVILSVLCWYELARTLQFSPRAAGASAILQLAFLLLLSDYLHPGSPYFNQLSADKATAAFIMAPVFFQSLMRLLDQPTKRNSLISLLTGLSLTFMHPVILAYSVFIGGALVLFRLKRKALPQLLLAIGIFIIILSPQVALRFASAHLQTDIPFIPEDVPNQRGMENLIARWGDTQFYGFNPRILDMNVPYGENIPIPEPVARQGWLILPVVSALFAVTRVRHNAASQFILACFLLCLLAWIPFTGWIIGYFLSAWMLERALWLFPFGLSSIFALTIIRDFARTRRPIKNSAAANLLLSPNLSLLTITFLTLGLFFLHVRENNLPDFEKFTRKMQRYKDIALAGQAMDRQIMEQAYVMGSQNLNDLIPGITLKANLITYRISDPANMLYFTQAERERRIADTAAIFSKSTPAEDKLSLLEKYNVRFLLLQRGDLLLFEDLTTRHPDRAKAIEVGGVILLEIND